MAPPYSKPVVLLYNQMKIDSLRLPSGQGEKTEKCHVENTGCRQPVAPGDRKTLPPFRQRR
jgi:hypothetical protein